MAVDSPPRLEGDGDMQLGPCQQADVVRTRSLLPTVLFWLVAASLVFCSLGARSLWGSEDRWAEIAREMRLTGDYFHPCINGEPYFDKPLLGYWLICPAAAVLGRLDEAAARLPSAVAALVALAATMSLARRLGSDRQARAAGWILLSMWGFLFWARTAEADMENLAAIILAVAWYWARRDKPGFLSYLVFYLICFIGAQTKGLGAIALPILVVLPDVVRANRWRSYLSASHAAALLVGLSVYLAPLAYAELTRADYHASGLYAAFKENVVRYFRPFDHKEPFYVYFMYVPELVLPWVPLFLAALWRSILMFRRSDWPGRWLTLSILLVFLFFTVSGSRRSYYILPILPFCAILVSRFFEMDRGEKWNRVALHLQVALLAAIAAFEVLTPAFWPVVKRRIGFVVPTDFVYVTVLLGLAALLPLIVERVRPGLLAPVTATISEFGPSILMSAVMVGGFFVLQERILERFRSIRSFSLDLKDRVAALPPENVAYYRQYSVRTLFYMGLPEPIRSLQDTNQANDFLIPNGEPKVIISRRRFEKDLVGAFPDGVVPEPILKERTYPWEENKDPYEAWIIPGKGR